MNYSSKLLILLFSIHLLFSCKTKDKLYTPLVIREDSTKAVINADRIRRNTPIEHAEGINVSLWASDSLAPDPVAMSIDDYGRVYLTRTNRQKNSEFDIRGYQQWMIASISLQSVEDRRNFLRTTFSTEKSTENEWLPDLNADTIHDWRDLTVEKDEVWRLEDVNGNGFADVSTRIVNDFNEEITDVAGAILVREKDMFVGIGPDMWRLKDNDGDGIPDEKTSISHGYAVHIGFGGHGMSGVVQGPDGKIYWGIGDIGANITTNEGVVHKYPNQGILVRSNPDGSNFEVFAAGLRNTHEFTFDEYGNIIGADNDGDHSGERERLVYIVEGADAGWRSNWQYGKYTDPKNNSYNVWMDEKLHIPRWEGQAAYIIPPIVNYHNGPTGMVYNPGTALGSRWVNKFFLVEFVGNPTRSHIWSFSLRLSGASFELDEEVDLLSGILPTGIRFGPDGALYAADWINGWGTKNYGRVWKIDVTKENNDLAKERLETKRLMVLDYSTESDDNLYQLLFYQDMRIRQKAQFELASRNEKGVELFKRAVTQKENQMVRVHGIWGIGQMTQTNTSYAENLKDLLNDSDPEIIAQTAKIIGDVRFSGVSENLIQLLKNENSRVRFFAAQALGRLSYAGATEPLINLLEENNDQDLYIRHACVLALSRIGAEEAVVNLENHKSRALRIAAVLVLRRLQSEKVALFLDDADEYIVTEAARAINDDWSIETSLESLANTLEVKAYTAEPLLRRGINAASRLGGQKNIDLVIDVARRTDISDEIRAEALRSLGNWASPSVLDRVDGRFRGEISRDPNIVKSRLEPHVSWFLNSSSEIILVATSETISRLKLESFTERMNILATSHSSPEVRSSMITSLGSIGYQNLKEVIRVALNDKDENVRSTAIGYLNELDIEDDEFPGFVLPLFSKGSVKEQQQLLNMLGKISLDKSEIVFNQLTDMRIAGQLLPAISLDLLEAVDATGSVELSSKMDPFRSTGTSLADFSDLLYGGDSRKGARIFWSNPTAQCIRCHSWDNEPGAVGPSLRNIGNILSREELLQALIQPSARLAPGFGTIILTLTDGTSVSGILMEETDSEVLLKTADAEPLEIPIARITSRQIVPSSMPPMINILSKREIRDVVEFLSNLK